MKADSLNAFAARCLPAALAAAFTLLAITAGNTPARADSAGIFDSTPLTITDGAQIYAHICQSCHMPQGQGAEGAGRYPALAHDPALASWQYMALTVLKGRRNMPAFSAKHAVAAFFVPVMLTDAQVAAVINYVRTHFGNHYQDLATAAEVHALDP